MSRPHVPPTVPGKGCDVFAQAAVLRVDRELGPAEAAALDAHLAICPACRLRAAQAEALSTVLKEWDADRGGRARAPARLRLKIRGAAVEQGRWRRREVRLVRRVRLATAASILLALGAGLFVGLLSVNGAAAPYPGEPAPVAVARLHVPAHAGPRPLGDPFEVPALTGVAVTPSSLGDLKLEDGRSEWLAPRERIRAFRHLQRSEVMTLQREAFEARHGEKAVWERDPTTGTLRLITFARMRFGDRIAAEAAQWRPAPIPPTGESTTVADRNPTKDTGRRIGHFLRLPARRAGMQRILGGRPIPLANPGGRFGDVVFLPRPKGGPSGGAPVLDLIQAAKQGVLVLREGQGDDLVAITRGLPRPVFVPPGELIRGGHVDRVVLEGVWIAVNDEQVPTTIRCAPAGTPGASHGEHPEPTGLMAGPNLRRFLATRLHPDAVRAWIGEHVPIQDEQGRDFSLLAWYSPDMLAQNLKALVEPLLKQNARGFVVRDPAGNLVGVETTELPAWSAAPLLARLVNGYLVESAMDWKRARLRGASGVPAARTGGREASLALIDLMGAEATFRHRVMGGRGIRVLRMTEPTTRTVVDVAERLPQGTGVLTSAFAP